MGNPEERLAKLGIELPTAPKPLGSYVPSVRAGRLIFLSGILPLREGRLMRKGRVGKDVTAEEAMEDARTAAVNAISILKAEVGELSKVCRCIRISGFVSSAEGFFDQPKVLNSASDLMVEVFGDAGRHARSAVGVSALPLDSPIEIEFIFELED